MKKNRTIAILLMCLILTSLVGCGNKQTPPPETDTVIAETVGSTADVTSATDTSDDITAATTESKVSESSTAEKEEETKQTEEVKETTSPTTSASAVSTQAPPKATEPTETTADTQETAKPTETTTVKPTEPPVTEPAETTAPEETTSTETKATEAITPETTPTETKPAQTEPKPTEPAETEPQGFTTADRDRIIAEVKAYAESYTAKGYTYIWKAGMEFSEDVGYMGTPRIKRDGVDGVIRILKHHIDLIYKTTTDPSNGITCDEMTYRVMQIDLDGEIAFVVVYGG